MGLRKIVVTALKILVFFVGWFELNAIVINHCMPEPCDLPIAVWHLLVEVIIFAALLVFTIVFLAI